MHHLVKPRLLRIGTWQGVSEEEASACTSAHSGKGDGAWLYVTTEAKDRELTDVGHARGRMPRPEQESGHGREAAPHRMESQMWEGGGRQGQERWTRGSHLIVARCGV